MRRVCLLLVVLLIPACTSNDKKKLAGNWECEDPPEAHCTLSFTTTGWMTLTLPDGHVISGRYKLLASDIVEFQLDLPWNGMQIHRERVTMGYRELTLTDPGGTSVRFKRAGFRSGS